MGDTFSDILRAVVGTLQTPTVICLLILLSATVFMAAGVLVEALTERRRIKTKIPELVDRLQNKGDDSLTAEVEKSGLLHRHKSMLKELVGRRNLPLTTRRSVAAQLLFQEQKRYNNIIKISNLMAKLGPMLGLMGTLIPLAPGLIGLGQGDMETLSGSLLTAFDTTVAGLVAAGVSILISAVRKSWYDYDITSMETLLETILDVQEASGKAEASDEGKA